MRFPPAQGERALLYVVLVLGDRFPRGVAGWKILTPAEHRQSGIFRYMFCRLSIIPIPCAVLAPEAQAYRFDPTVSSFQFVSVAFTI